MLKLDKLWRGEIAPYDKHIKKDSEYGKLLHGLCEREDQLQKELTEKGKSLYTDIQDVQSAMNAKENQAAFEKGFRLGIGLLLDALYERSSDFSYAGEQ